MPYHRWIRTFSFGSTHSERKQAQKDYRKQLWLEENQGAISQPYQLNMILFIKNQSRTYISPGKTNILIII